MMEHLSLVPYEGGGGGGEKYKECMRNHAAAMGGQAFDGCGEFMPDSPDSLKCAACGCHRSFHRRAAAAVSSSPAFFRPPPPPLTTPPAPHHHHHHVAAALQAFLPPPVAPSCPPHLALPYHAVPAGAAAPPWNVVRAGSETPPRPGEDCFVGGLGSGSGGGMGRKRFRTKFTPEQKERMREFAEQQGWRINRNDDGAMERFCLEIGVRRQVLKVWMHNHKNHYGHKGSQTQHPPVTTPSPSQAHAAAVGGGGGIANPAIGTTSTGANIPGMGVGVGDDDDDDDDDTDDSPPRAAVSSPSPSPISV